MIKTAQSVPSSLAVKVFGKKNVKDHISVNRRKGRTMSFGLEPLYKRIMELEEKEKKCLQVFYDQPSMVIQWTPDKKHYSWGFVTSSRAEAMLKEILEILTSEDHEDAVSEAP